MAITWIELNRRPEEARSGVDVTCEFTDSVSGQKMTKTMFFVYDPTIAQVDAKCQRSADGWEFDLNILNSFVPSGDDSAAIMVTMTEAVRANALINEAALISLIEKGHPDTLYKADKFIAQSMVEASCKTFDDFKTTLANEKIIGVDDKSIEVIK